jgi:cell volume regulation protein A
MFFALGLLVFPSQFGPVAVKALLLALITALLARPLAATVATVRQGFTRSERAMLAWAGLRGAVPVILATFAVIAGVPRSVELLNIVFFAVLVSAVLQGPTVHALAARIWTGGTDLSGSHGSRSDHPGDAARRSGPDSVPMPPTSMVDPRAVCLRTIAEENDGS